jgi:hypothetical protein
MMSGLLPLHRLKRRPPALGLVLHVFLSKTLIGDAKRPPRTKTGVNLRRLVRLSLAQRLDTPPVNWVNWRREAFNPLSQPHVVAV